MVFFIEDFRCAETIPGTILVEFGGFQSCVIFYLWISGVLKVYLVLFWVTLGLFGFVVLFIEDVRCAEGIPGTW